MKPRKTVWNTFLSKRKDKGGKSIDSEQWDEAMKAKEVSDDMATSLGSIAANTLGGLGLNQSDIEELKKQYAMQQQAYTTATAAQQLQNAYGANTATTTWTSGNTLGSANTIYYPPNPGTATVPFATPTPIWTDPTVDMNQINHTTTLLLITLITAVGPEMCRRLLKKFKLEGLMTGKEFDSLAKKVTGTLSGEDDPNLDQTIEQAVKELKV